jgi:membrane-bound lytic murein transglycosylase
VANGASSSTPAATTESLAAGRVRWQVTTIDASGGRLETGQITGYLKDERVRGRLVGKRVVPYPDRAAIGRGEGPRGKELMWVDSSLETFFLHVQGLPLRH